MRATGHVVVGYARRPETRRRAREMGAADEVYDTLAKAVGGDVLLLATPVLAMRQLLIDVAPHVPAGTVVSDVASTKVHVERWARRYLPAHVRFVGGHPMAGRETAGIEYADGDLFRGRTWCIVPPMGAERTAVELVTRLAADTGATPLQLTAAGHDRAVAATSHLPFMAAATLCQAVIARDDFDQMAPMAGTGLRDTTRLASGDAFMHRDICLTNRDHLLRELEHFSDRLAEVTELVRRLPEPDLAENSPELAELEAFFARLKHERDGWVEG